MSNSFNKIVNAIGGFFIGGFWGVLGVVLFLFSQILAIVLCMILRLDTDIYEGVYGFLAAVFGIVIIGFYSYLRGGFSVKKNTLVFKDKPNAEIIFPAIVIAFGLMGVVLLYFVVVDNISSIIPKVSDEYDTYNQAMDRYSEVDASAIPFIDSWLNFISVCFLVPIVEELTFRGILLGELARKIHPALAVVVSSVVFGTLHGLSIQIGYALISGIIIGFVYYVTHSIWATITLHSVFNFWGAGFVTLLEGGVFGDQELLIDKVNTFSSYFNLMMIIPSFVCLFFLWKRYKDNKYLEDKEKAAVTAEAEV